MKNIRKLAQNKLVAPLGHLVSQGVAPKKIAMALSVGTVIGIFPVVGATTIIGTGIALFFRLNLPALHLANMAVYPLQVLLLVPFMEFGAWMFDAEPLAMSTAQSASLFESGIWKTVALLWDTTLRAIAAWILISVPAAAGLYLTVKPILARVGSNN